MHMNSSHAVFNILIFCFGPHLTHLTAMYNWKNKWIPHFHLKKKKDLYIFFFCNASLCESKNPAKLEHSDLNFKSQKISWVCLKQKKKRGRNSKLISACILAFFGFFFFQSCFKYELWYIKIHTGNTDTSDCDWLHQQVFKGHITFKLN